MDAWMNVMMEGWTHGRMDDATSEPIEGLLIMELLLTVLKSVTVVGGESNPQKSSLIG